jgi:hypothetical protein
MWPPARRRPGEAEVHDGCRLTERRHSLHGPRGGRDFRKEAAMYSGGIAPPAPVCEYRATQKGVCSHGRC